MSIQTKIDFDTPADHTVSSNIEVAGGVAQYTSIVDSDEDQYFNFETDGDNTALRGDETVELNGGAVVDNGHLECLVSGSFGAIENYDSFTGDFAFRFHYAPNYTTVVSNTNIFQLVSNQDSSLIRFYHQNQGGGVTRMWCEILNASGSTLTSTLMFSSTLTLLEDHEVVVSCNSSEVRVFVNGVLEVTTGAWTRDMSDCRVVFSNNGTTKKHEFAFFQSFTAHKFTGSTVVFPMPEQTLYSVEEETVETSVPLTMSSLTAAAHATNPTGTAVIKYYLTVDNLKKYWSGSAWVESDGTFAQSNTIEDINTNASALQLLEAGSTVKITAVFLSSDGFTQIQLEEICLTYNYHFNPSAKNLCVVYGTLLDNAGQPISGATVEVNGPDFHYNNNLIAGKAKTTTDASGNWNMQMVETATDSQTVKVKFTYTNVDGEEKTRSFPDLTIPNETTKAFVDIVEGN